MRIQNQIKQTLSLPDSIEIIRSLLANNAYKNRSSLANAVCLRFDFHNALGRPQTGGCVKGLRELERAGHFVLPKSKMATVVKSPRRLNCPVPDPIDVPEKAGEIRGLSLVLVDSVDQMRIWNEMMLCEHPQGAGPFVGCQLRYLITSEHGWLGGFAFSAAALNLRDRDQWIGWDTDTHSQQLHRILGMSRFLLRTSVHCHNLASLVLGMVLRQVGIDFETQYGYTPWLVESFVDTEQFSGTCYKAANWTAIGLTQGRGRQDRENNKSKSIKTIYIYAIESDWRVKMGVAKPVGLQPLEISQGLDADLWAEQEFGGANLGDRRLNERLVRSAQALGAMPGRTFSGAVKGDWPTVKGFYRMIDKPDDSALTAEAILAPHRESTIRRMMGQSTVLCIQDGSSLNYNNLDQCEGLGILSKNQTGAKTRGIHLHSTYVISTDGLPLGLLKAQFSAPQPKTEPETRPTASIPIEEKKTFAWINGLRDCVEVSKLIPNTHQINVCDREGDFFEFFDEQRTLKAKNVDLLVRSKHDRTIDDKGHHLFESVRSSPVCAEIEINVPRQSTRTKKSKQKAKPGHAKRIAKVAVRYLEIELLPGAYQKDKAPIKVRIVHVQETTNPEDDEPVEWFLLTTCDVSSPEQAIQILRWYCLRWRIEDWHRVLKSGCNIEKLQHKTVERLKRTIAINLVIAWRIMLMTLLGRQCPELPAEVLFSDIEIKVIREDQKKKSLNHSCLGKLCEL